MKYIFLDNLEYSVIIPQLIIVEPWNFVPIHIILFYSIQFQYK